MKRKIPGRQSVIYPDGEIGSALQPGDGCQFPRREPIRRCTNCGQLVALNSDGELKLHGVRDVVCSGSGRLIK